jgi:thiazolinyl reductase component of yersiniabactin synthetase
VPKSHPIPVVICGTNYGRAYLDAISAAHRRYTLVGLVARGSQRSQNLACRLRLPLWGNAAEIPPHVKLACVALGIDGESVTLDILNRGIAVLCEHPVRPAFLRAALKLASRRNARFHVNTHFPELPAPCAFISHASQLSAQSAPRFIAGIATERSLYSVLEILRRAIGKLNLHHISHATTTPNAEFKAIHAQFGHADASLLIQDLTATRKFPTPDAHHDYLLDFRLTLGFPANILTLAGLAGPVFSQSPYNSSTSSSQPLWRIIQANNPRTIAQLAHLRVAANLKALDDLTNAGRREEHPNAQSPQHLLDVSTAWEAITKSRNPPAPRISPRERYTGS